MRAGLLEEKDPARLLGPPGAGGRQGAHPPGRLQGDIRQERPVFPQAGAPGSSVGAPSDENMTGSSTLDPFPAH